MAHASEPGMDTSARATIDDRRRIKPFYELLTNLGNELLNCELAEAQIMCRGQGVPEEKLHTQQPLELLRTLDDMGIIGEDNTDFLKQLLHAAGCLEGKEYVEVYEQERSKHLKDVEILLGRKDQFFVGRTKYVSKILDVFHDTNNVKCRCVLVYGLAGTGKTKLAVESCAIYKGQQKKSATRLYRVNLRKATKAEEVWLWTLNSVAGRQVTQSQFNMPLVKDWIKKCCQDTIILLDNADDIIRPSSTSRDHFINTITDILDLNNAFVKILMTSRHPVDVHCLKDLPNFLELKLEPLQVHDSIYLLRKMVDQAQSSSGIAVAGGDSTRDDTPLFEIAKLCGNNPQALRALASRLSSGFQPDKLIEHLKIPALIPKVLDPGSLAASTAVQDERKDFEDQPMVLSALSITYEELPQHLKEVLLKLSVLPTSFSLQQGAMILGRDKPDEVKYDLEDLRKWCLIDKENFDDFDCGVNDDDTYYYIHPLVRSTCLTKLKSSKLYEVAYEDAVRRFFVYINDRLKQLTELGHKDFSRALSKFQLEKTNVFHYLELDMGNKFGCKVNETEQTTVNPTPLPDTREGLYSIFETFLEPSKRLEYYQNRSRVMLSRKEIEGWAYLQGWVADELVVKAKYDDAWETVEEPLKILQVRETESGITNDLERARAQLMYVKGRVLVGRREYSKAFEVLKQALSMQQRILGNHSVTARCLNALGHAYYNKADEGFLSSGVDEAHEYHKKAWEMLVKVTDGKPEKHFDAPMYLLNIGASYHQMGKKNLLLRKGKAKKFFELAIANYNEAYELARALRLTNSSNSAFILKNMAMSHCEMEDYEKALPLAIHAAEIREKSIGIHPTTARNLYFIGSLYDSLGDKYIKKDKKTSDQHFTDALEYYNKALKMEMQLGPRGHSIEYEDLKTDLQSLLKKRQGDKTELETYQRIFHDADKSAMSPEEVTLTFDSLPDVARQSARGQHEPQDDDDMDVNEADDNSGATRRRAPAPVFMQETASKKRRCNIQ
ncbi:uncharacterized protein LOC117298435 [Asterias rubens]|uniref:uncharacterized protein LOC117298435 n=1 Tax=Asterias rubens TaxID=7604 RepID=UPI001455AD00|nr:uncharacterized protein LOC117298435 [Asterias rubens]